MLDGDTDAITITGTPGIGKSFFFGYFHVRCNFENPLVAIITASFKSKGEMSMMQSVVVRKNSEVVIETKVPSEMEDLIEEAEDKAKGQALNFKPYKIELHQKQNDEGSVYTLNGIDKTKEALFNAEGINTIGKLRKRMEEAEARNVSQRKQLWRV
ncbi:hypothetical protein PC111_g23217 [Phytophthora cactorum]|nr:hypothetical protein PC111_g23217 [Phytophthora cactorum]